MVNPSRSMTPYFLSTISITYPSLETNRISSHIKSIIESPTLFIKPYFPSFYK